MTQVAIALSDRKEYIRTDISRKHAILFALIGEERAVRSGLLHVLIEPFIRFASVSPYTEVIASERALDSARVLDLATVNSPYMQDWFAHYHLASLNGMNSAEDLTQDLLRSMVLLFLNFRNSCSSSFPYYFLFRMPKERSIC